VYARADTPAFREHAALHEKMLAAYRGRAWDEASALAQQCLDLRSDLIGLYTLYLQRIHDFKTTPPPADWQGVWVAKEK
jgi:adenylate cyclase